MPVADSAGMHSPPPSKRACPSLRSNLTEGIVYQEGHNGLDHHTSLCETRRLAQDLRELIRQAVGIEDEKAIGRSTFEPPVDGEVRAFWSNRHGMAPLEPLRYRGEWDPILVTVSVLCSLGCSGSSAVYDWTNGTLECGIFVDVRPTRPVCACGCQTDAGCEEDSDAWLRAELAMAKETARLVRLVNRRLDSVEWQGRLQWHLWVDRWRVYGPVRTTAWPGTDYAGSTRLTISAKSGAKIPRLALLAFYACSRWQVPISRARKVLPQDLIERYIRRTSYAPTNDEEKAYCWNNNQQDWHQLRCAMTCGKPASRS
jgi:hypothetical protein